MPERLVEVYRGDLVESIHFGHVVISNNIGKVLACWGNPATLIYPRSSCKIIQALPLVEVGLERGFSLTEEHLALACASHSGGEIHLNVAKDWLQKIKLQYEKNNFTIEGIGNLNYQNELIIKYEGILPDLFDENAGVVVRGNLNTDGTFTAIEVLEKHDENYMPPEVAEMLIEEK